MAVTVETLEKLERKIILTLSAAALSTEVETRLKKIAKTVKMPGFRPGKVPMNIVAQQYGYSAQYEVMNERVGAAFNAAITEAKLNVAGQPKINELESVAGSDELKFEAFFEVYPEVMIKDLSTAEIQKFTSEVTDEAIEKTVAILQKQRRSFAQRSMDAGVEAGDRVTVDFEGKIDGEVFEGGRATDFQFLVGEGQMLKEFDDAVRGMKPGESKTFPLAFPEDYQSQEVAGKTADFMVTIKKNEAAHLPEINDELAKSLGVKDATVAGLKADIRSNLEREVKFRLVNKNKVAVMDALIANAELELPKTIVQSEVDRMVQGARDELKQRGIKDADKAPIPTEIFTPQAERRVRLGLIVSELVKANNLQTTIEQIKAHVTELAASYEKPEEVVKWYMGDRQRLGEVDAILMENNVTEFVLAKAKVVPKSIEFDELMAQQ
ncbi:MAG: trigger factor [Cytophagales bacterium]|nr:trigger factor [Cytophagales bacterium]